MKFELMTDEEKRRRLEEPIEEFQEVQEEIPQPVEQLEAPIAVSEPEASKRFDYASEMDALNQEYEAKRAAAEPKKRGFGRILADAVVGALAGRQGSQEILKRRDEKTEAEKKQVLQDFLNKKGLLRDRMDMERVAASDELARSRDSREQTKLDLEAKRIQETEQRRVEAEDPASPYSLAKVRRMAEVYGINPDEVVGKISAAEAEKFVNEHNNRQNQIRAQEHSMKVATMNNDRKTMEAQLRAEAAQKKAEEDRKRWGTQKVTNFRKEAVSGMPGKAYEVYDQLDKVWQVADQAAKGGGNPYIAVGLALTAAKALQGDTSVVREAELRAFNTAGSLMTKVESHFQKGLTGDPLTPLQKQQLKEAMDVIRAASRRAYLKAAAPIVNQAKALDLPMDQIFPEGFVPSENELEDGLNLSKQSGGVAKSDGSTLDADKKRLEEIQARKAALLAKKAGK